MKERVPAHVLEVLGLLERHNFQAYLVGGCVRDLLRGAEPNDWDIASSALPQVVEGLFPKVIPTGVQFGTVTVFIEGKGVEVTTFRREWGYRDGRRPSWVVFGRDIETDLKRRDFTINAMAYNPLQDKLVDPTGGQRDLAEGIIRAVGQPLVRFREDSLRIMRGVRLAGQLGAEIETETWQSIRASRQGLKRVAPERVREELERILAQETTRGLNLLVESGVLSLLFPQLFRTSRYSLKTVLKACSLVPPDKTLRMAALLAGLDQVEAPLVKLRFPKFFCRRVGHLVAHHSLFFRLESSLGAMRFFLSQLGLQHLPDLLLLARGLALASGDEMVEKQVKLLSAQLQKLAREDFPLSPSDLALKGDQLMQELGLSPGPLLGRIQRKLWEEVLEEPTRNEYQWLIERARQLARELT